MAILVLSHCFMSVKIISIFLSGSPLGLLCPIQVWRESWCRDFSSAVLAGGRRKILAARRQEASRQLLARSLAIPSDVFAATQSSWESYPTERTLLRRGTTPCVQNFTSRNVCRLWTSGTLTRMLSNFLRGRRSELGSTQEEGNFPLQNSFHGWGVALSQELSTQSMPKPQLQEWPSVPLQPGRTAAKTPACIHWSKATFYSLY